MAKRNKNKTYSTEGMGKNKNSITKVNGVISFGTIKVEAQQEKFNPFQTGHGVQGGGKKQKNKKSRKEGKQLCRQFC